VQQRNNATLSRELKANAHLFGYLFAERHVSLRQTVEARAMPLHANLPSARACQ